MTTEVVSLTLRPEPNPTAEVEALIADCTVGERWDGRAVAAG